MGGEKSVYEVLKWLKKSPYNELCGSSDQLNKPDSDKSCYVIEDDQVFTDHVLAAKRFQKTLYYGEISSTAFHSSLALTDVTLELFNKTVPNEGRLDILDMDYASHISKSVSISPYSMILAMMYVEQLRHKNPDYLENVSPCDLYVVSMLVASKYLFDDDDCIYNYDWTDVTNLEIADLNRLEMEFLSAVNWELFIKPSEYSNFLALVEQKIALKRSSERGWLSYTDICVLVRKDTFTEFWLYFSKFALKVIVVVVTGYVCSVLILCGSAFLIKLVINQITSESCQAAHFDSSGNVPSIKNVDFYALKGYFCHGQNCLINKSNVHSDTVETIPRWFKKDTERLTCPKNFLLSVHETSHLIPYDMIRLHSGKDAVKLFTSSLITDIEQTKHSSKKIGLCENLNCSDSVIVWPLYSLYYNQSF